MAELNNCANSPDKISETTHIGKKVAVSNDRQSNGHNSDDYDTDSECWDDARALLDDDVSHEYSDDLKKNANKKQPFKQPRKQSNDTVDGHVQSHPSANPKIKTVNNDISSNSAKASVQPLHSKPPQCSADDLILHEAVFNNDTGKILNILNDAELVKQRELVNKKDKHGNTALHLACMLGRSTDVINALLQNKHGFKWSISVKNLNRWTPFNEACSYGNREVISILANQLKDEVDDALHKSKLSDFLGKTRDYRLVLKWEFQSWVPFVSRVLPSDVCVITKQGKYVRIDTRLFDFEGLFRKKGSTCLVYSNKKWIVINFKTKKYQNLETPAVYKDIEKKVDDFMSTDIIDVELKSSGMQLTRSTSGWIWKADKVGKVAGFNAALYDLNNVFLMTRKRREHLSEEDLKRNKSAYKTVIHALRFGEMPNNHDENRVGQDENNNTDDEGEDDAIVHRQSLPPPPPADVSWQEYMESEPGNHPNLGRKQKCKLVKTAVKASVAMSEEFPLSKEEFLELLSIIPLKMFEKLKEFVEMKLPDGFPVRLDIPVFPFLTARITFEDFAFLDTPVDESLFAVPQDFEQDNNLLFGRFRCEDSDSEADP